MNQVRIILSTEASTRLSEMGERAFTVATRQVFPDDPSRWVLYVKAIDTAVVNDAIRVLTGELRAVPIPSEPELSTARLTDDSARTQNAFSVNPGANGGQSVRVSPTPLPPSRKLSFRPLGLTSNDGRDFI